MKNSVVTNIILCTMMGFLTLFFIVLMNNFSVYSLIWAVFLMYLFCRMCFVKREKKSRYRRIFQIVFAVLFCISFIANLYKERGSMAITACAMSNAELPFCHIAIPQILLPWIITGNIVFPARIMNHYAAVGSMLVIWLAVTLTVGRGWCSWICFYGGWEEGFSSIGKKRKINLLPKNKELREFQLGFLIFIVLMSLCELASVYCKWFCPFKLVTEYSPMNSVPSIIAGVIFIGLFIGLVIVMPLLSKKRVQCSTLCPFGAFASLTDKVSLFRVKINTEKCTGCMKCATTCKFSAIDIKTIQDKKGHPEFNCAKCGDCIGVCPQNAISFDFKFSKKCDCHNKDAKGFVKVIKELCHPENLFRFAAFSFSVVMSSNFACSSMELIVNSFLKLF